VENLTFLVTSMLGSTSLKGIAIFLMGHMLCKLFRHKLKKARTCQDIKDLFNLPCLSTYSLLFTLAEFPEIHNCPRILYES